MTLQLRSETLYSAPRGSPNTRRLAGIGEPISFASNESCNWTIPDNSITGRHREATVVFDRPGAKIISANNGSERAEITIEVVEPRVHVRKIEDVRADMGLCGALMRLEFTLTPLEVSFQGIEFRECECEADEIWGYFHTHRATYERIFHHDPRGGDRTLPEWKAVDSQNRVAALDAAGFSMRASQLNWPITVGGFRWQIPDEYRIGTQIGQLSHTMPQTIRMEPSPSCTTAPFRGKIIVRKGGVETEQVYR